MPEKSVISFNFGDNFSTIMVKKARQINKTIFPFFVAIPVLLPSYMRMQRSNMSWCSVFILILVTLLVMAKCVFAQSLMQWTIVMWIFATPLPFLSHTLYERSKLARWYLSLWPFSLIEPFQTIISRAKYQPSLHFLLKVVILEPAQSSKMVI